MSTASVATGGKGSTLSQATPSSNTSPAAVSKQTQAAPTTKQEAPATTKAPATIVSVVEQTDSFIALEPAPTDSATPSQPSSTQQQPLPQSAAPTTKNPPQTPTHVDSPSTQESSPSSHTQAQSQPTIVPAIIPQSSTLSTKVSVAASIASSISASQSPTPSLVPLNGSPFNGSGDADATTPKKSSAGTIAGVVGGLSAAILLGVLGFFLWKWKKRGKYSNSKRMSFGPYGNGIDANRGGLLVSSVAKPADSLSNHEESLYSDDNSPTRYDRPSLDLNREPTLPSVGALPERSMMSPTSPPKVRFGMEKSMNSSYGGQPPYRPVDPMLAVAGVAPLMNRASPVRPHGGVLYEPRRPPVPPSMRRNRSPPQPPGSSGYNDMEYMGRPNPGMSRSNSNMNTNSPNRSLPSLPYGASPANGGRMMPPPAMRQVRRSASAGNMDGRFHSASSPFDPLSMHPVIPEVPSGPTTPVHKEMTGMFEPSSLNRASSITKSPVEMHRGAFPPPTLNPPNPSPSAAAAATAAGGPGRSMSLTTPRPTMSERWSNATADADRPKVLTVRNPSPDREREDSKLGSIVRRVSSLRQGGEHTTHKPGDAAKNF